MKFKRQTVRNPETQAVELTVKTYECPVCGYITQTEHNKDGEKRTIGDQDFTLFPFFSLYSLSGATKEICECPKCTTIQAIEYIYDDLNS